MTRHRLRSNLPFVVENAPGVAAAICGNRQTSVQAETSDGFNTYVEPTEIVALQNDCGESGFVIDRGNTKKKKRSASTNESAAEAAHIGTALANSVSPHS